MEELSSFVQTNYKSSNFATSFLFLNSTKKKALSIFYNFARYVDDIADSDIPHQQKIEKLIEIKEKIKEIYSKKENEKLKEIAYIIREFSLPSECFYELIDGMLYDCGDVDISSQQELEGYMYKVAGVVGISVLKICGYSGKNLEEIARYTGYAVQLTNIIRDFYEDYQKKRIYIPKEHRIKILKTEKINLYDLSKIKELLSFEKSIAQDYYKTSSRLIAKNREPSLFVSSLMKNIYYEVLEGLDFETIKKNHKISNYKKLKAIFNSLIEIYFGR
jgi:phytoene synthase